MSREKFVLVHGGLVNLILPVPWQLMSLWRSSGCGRIPPESTTRTSMWSGAHTHRIHIQRDRTAHLLGQVLPGGHLHWHRLRLFLYRPAGPSLPGSLSDGYCIQYQKNRPRSPGGLRDLKPGIEMRWRGTAYKPEKSHRRPCWAPVGKFTDSSDGQDLGSSERLGFSLSAGRILSQIGDVVKVQTR